MTSPTFSTTLARGIEDNILGLIVAGLELWSERGFPRHSDDERDLNFQLVQCMRDVRRQNFGVYQAFRLVYERPEESEEIKAGIQAASEASRVDVTLWLGHYEPDDVYFAIECKRVGDQSLARLYVSKGISRFVAGSYTPSMDAGAMVAYVVSGLPEDVPGQINHALDSNASFGTGDRLAVVQDVGGASPVCISRHRRMKGSGSIRLTHLFYDLTGASPVS